MILYLQHFLSENVVNDAFMSTLWQNITYLCIIYPWFTLIKRSYAFHGDQACINRHYRQYLSPFLSIISTFLALFYCTWNYHQLSRMNLFIDALFTHDSPYACMHGMIIFLSMICYDFLSTFINEYIIILIVEFILFIMVFFIENILFVLKLKSVKFFILKCVISVAS